jgi:hypothetical protein
VCVSLSLSYTPVVFMHLYSLSRAYTPLVFMHLYSLSLSHSTYSVAMMEFARLCRFAVCNKFLPLSVSRWDHFFVDTAGSRGGETVTARVADSCKSSLELEASDDDGEQQLDDSSEALPAGECLYLSEVMGICATGKRGGAEAGDSNILVHTHHLNLVVTCIYPVCCIPNTWIFQNTNTKQHLNIPTQTTDLNVLTNRYPTPAYSSTHSRLEYSYNLHTNTLCVYDVYVHGILECSSTRKSIECSCK